MADRVGMNNLRNLIVKTVAVYEGTVQKKDIVSPNGGIIKDAIVRSAPVAKGDLVSLTAAVTQKNIPIVGPLSGVLAIGQLVSDPQGIDPAAPAVAAAPNINTETDRLRRADVAFFGVAIVELESHSVAQTPGNQYRISAAGAAFSANGQAVVLRAAAAGEKCPVLLGANGVLTA